MNNILVIIAFFFTSSFLYAQNIVSAELLLKEGDLLSTSTINLMRGMSVNLEGECAIGFDLDNNDDGLWSEGNVLHLNSDFALNLSGIESTMDLVVEEIILSVLQ